MNTEKYSIQVSNTELTVSSVETLVLDVVIDDVTDVFVFEAVIILTKLS